MFNHIQHGLKNCQKGRSMIEMLGVLSIIGVLSITGIVGIQFAMQIYKENETVHAFSSATAGARTAELMDSYIYTCDRLPCIVSPNAVISTKYETRSEDFSTATSAPVIVRIESRRGYTVRIKGISKQVCEAITSGYWGETCSGIDNNNGGLTQVLSEDCRELSQSIDCSQFQNATEGMSRRSLLQQEIDDKKLSSTISYQDYGTTHFSSLVLYYGNNYIEDDDPEWSFPREPDDTPSNPGADADWCTNANGVWRASTCCEKNASRVEFELGSNSINKTCCEAAPINGEYRVDSNGNAHCCDTNPNNKGKDIHGALCGICITDCPIGTVYHEKNGKGVCCKKDSPFDENNNFEEICCEEEANGVALKDNNKDVCCAKLPKRSSRPLGVPNAQPVKACCENANGKWKNNNTCCGSHSTAFAVDTNGICLRP